MGSGTVDSVRQRPGGLLGELLWRHTGALREPADGVGAQRLRGLSCGQRLVGAGAHPRLDLRQKPVLRKLAKQAGQRAAASSASAAAAAASAASAATTTS